MTELKDDGFVLAQNRCDRGGECVGSQVYRSRLSNHSFSFTIILYVAHSFDLYFYYFSKKKILLDILINLDKQKIIDIYILILILSSPILF